jgi:hypothetical protein
VPVLQSLILKRYTDAVFDHPCRSSINCSFVVLSPPIQTEHGKESRLRPTEYKIGRGQVAYPPEQKKELREELKLADKKIFARYWYVRDDQALWKGDPAEKDSHFRQFLITSNDWNFSSTPFQVYGLEGTGKGIANGEFIKPDEPTLIFDDDFNDYKTAKEKFDQLIAESEKRGFEIRGFFDEAEFQQKLRESKQNH